MIGRKLNILYKGDKDKPCVRCTVDKWTFQDKAMSVGGQYITFSIESETPIQFAVGDYCEYRGQSYFLNNLPSVSQTAKPKQIGNAFKYENVKFESVSNDLGRIMMLDITPTTGEYVAALGTNYTGSAQFQLFCGETKGIVLGKEVIYTPVCTLAGKIQANLDRAFPNDGWKIHVNLNSTKLSNGISQCVTHTDDKVMTFNNTTVAAALSEVQNTFKLDYFIKGKDIYIGYTLGAITGDNFDVKENGGDNGYFYFGYGKGYADKENQGKALFEIKKTANQSQQIITRLRALGSTKNMPYRYYHKRYNLSQSLFPQNLQLPDTFEIPSVKAQRNAQRKTMFPNLRAVLGDTNDAYLDKNDNCYSTIEGLREGVGMWDGSNQDLEEIYPTIKEATYGELRGNECEDIDGFTEAKGTSPDANNHKSFTNYEDLERIDEVLAVGYLDGNGTLIDDAHVGNGIFPDPKDKSHYIDRDSIIANKTINSNDIKNDGGLFHTNEVTLFEIKNQNAGNYFASASFYHVCAGVKLKARNSSSINVGYRLNIYLKPISTGKEIKRYSYCHHPGDIKSNEADFFEFPLPDLPDVRLEKTQIPEIKLTETSDVRVTFEIVFYEIKLDDTKFSIEYFVGESKKKPHTETGFKPQYRWGELQYYDDFVNTPFHVIIKDLGIKNFKAQFTGNDKPTMVMSDGHCVAREFEIGDDVKDVRYIRNGKTNRGWQLSLTRASDQSLHTYYPSTTDKISVGDHYVLVGVEMPDAYVKAAEMRLLTAATQYLAENSETKYTYEPHLDEIYLARNYDKWEEVGDVTKSVYWNLYAGLKFPFFGIPNTGENDEILPIVNITIESITIKEGDGLIPKVELTLNEKIEQTTYQRITTAVDKIYNGSIFGKGGNGGGMAASDVAMLIKRIGDNRFLRKDTPDTAQQLITFLEGLLLGDGKHGITEKGVATLLKVITDNIESRNFEKGILGNGFGMWTDADGRSYAEFDYLDIRRAATFRNISILELKHIGGELGLTAGAMQVSKVERLGGIYRCYFDTTDGKRTVYQEFVAGDQARCQQFRPKADKSGMLTTKYYWRLVTAVGNDYIDLSISDCDTGSSEPEVGDNIIQLGYRGTDHPERQSAVILSAVAFDAPSQKFYQGINSYNLTNCLAKDEGYDSSTGVFQTNVYGNAYIGNKDVTDFFEYKNGKATFSGEAHFKQGSTGGENIQGILTSGANLILNSGFCGNYKTKELAEDTLLKEQTELYSPSMFGWNGDADVREDSDSMSGFSVAIKTFISQFIKMGIIPGDTYSFTCKAKGSSLTVRIGGAEKSFSLTNDYQIIKMTCTPTAGNVLELIGPCDVCEPMLVAGNTQATWQRSPLDVDRAFDIQLAMSYLTDALANDTRINGGLLLSTLIKVGRLKNGKWKDAAGMSGIYNDDNDVAFYAGGTFEDAIRTVMTYMGNPTYHPTDEELQAMAKYVVTHGGRTILNDAILRGIIYADGGILRNIRTPNGSLVITEDGNVSIVGKFETSLNGKKITIDPDLGRFTLSGERTLSDGSKVNADHVVIDINDLRHHDDTFNYVPNVSCFDYHPDGNIRKITSVTPSGIYIEGREADANSYATYDATGMDLTLYDKLSKQATTLSCWLIRGDSGPIPYIRSNTFPTYDQAPVGGVYLSGDVLKVKLK